MFEQLNKVVVNSLLFVFLIALLVLPIASVSLVSYSSENVVGGVLSAQESAVIETEVIESRSTDIDNDSAVENENELVVEFTNSTVVLP